MADEPRPSPAKLPETADPYQDHDAIRSLVERKMSEWSKGREAIMRASWGAILYYLGHQWIVFDRFSNRWRQAILRSGTPTPVTNVYASTLDAFISLLARVEPRLQFPPATDEPDDQATADVCDRVIEVVEEEVGLRYQRQFGAVWNGLTGGFWLETGYDADPIHGMKFVQGESCLICKSVQPPQKSKTCQNCGAGMLSPAVDAKGQPIGEEYPVGKMYVDVVPLFEMYFDASVTDWRKQRACCRQKATPLDDAKARWPEFADQIQPDTIGNAGTFYTESLATIGPAVDDPQTQRHLQTGGRQQNNAVTERWYSQMPDATYPQGLLAIVVGKTLVVKAGPLFYSALNTDGSRTPFLNYTWFPQKLRPGSLWPKTIATDLMPIQAKRNRYESQAEQIAQRMANPVWLMPLGAGVKNVTGNAGQIIEYNALGPTPAKPERIQGQNVPATIMQLIEKCDATFEEIAGTFQVIKGDRPEGVSAGIALQLLKERGESRFAPMFILWEVSHAEWARQALEIFREYATEERILRIQGRDGSWEVQKFLGADLKGQVNILPEAASSFPKSTLTERAETEQAIAMGIINVADPETRLLAAKKYGVMDMLPGMKVETKNALRENEAYEQMSQAAGMMNPGVMQMAAQVPGGIEGEFNGAGVRPPTVKPSIDDHTIHAREHRQFARSETGQALHPAVMAMLEQHIAMHDQIAAMQAQAAMAARSGTFPTSGFLSNPGGQASPMRSGSSPARMQGDANEMAGTTAGGG